VQYTMCVRVKRNRNF